MTGIGRPAARAAVAFFVAFAAFQMTLALGAPFGTVVWGGSSPVLSPAMRAASAGAAVYLLLAAGVMLVRSGDLGRRLPGRLFWWINLVLALQMALNTLGNLVSATAVEKFGMGSASALGAALCVAALFAA